MDHRRRRAGAAFGAAALLLVLASGCTSHDSTPVRAAGYVSLTDAVPMTADGSAAQARLVGPHFDLEFTKIEATTENLAPAFRAAPGHEILLLHGDTTQQRPAYNAGSGDSVTASVVVDGATRPLQYLPAYGLAVSVPQGHTATLQVTDDGRTQSLDVRTGKRGKDAIAGYYRPHELKWTDADYHDTGRATCTGPRGTTHFTIDMSTTFGQAAGSLEPWLPGAGWAKDGRVWLRLSTLSMKVGTDPDAGDVTPANPDSLGGTYAVDLAKTFAVTFAGGQADAVPQPPQNTIDYAHGFDFGLVFDVPDSFAGGTLAIRPNGTLFAGPAGFQPGRPADARPVTWQKPLAAKQVPLTVSG